MKIHIVKPIMELYNLSYFRCKTLGVDNFNELGVFGYPVHNMEISDAFSGQYAGVDIESLVKLPVREHIGRIKYVEEKGVAAEAAAIIEQLAREIANAGKGEDL